MENKYIERLLKDSRPQQLLIEVLRLVSYISVSSSIIASQLQPTDTLAAHNVTTRSREGLIKPEPR